MVEVFKTNVADVRVAQEIINQIHEHFGHYRANFALDDCDKILRINCVNGFVSATEVIEIVEKNGYTACILVHDFQPRSFIF